VVDKDLDGVEERQLAAGGEDGFVDRVVGAEVAGVALDDGLAHVGNARHDGVAGEIGVDGGNGRVLDVARSGEMRLAGAEIHQVGAWARSLAASAATAMVAETSIRPMRSAKTFAGAGLS
jgi:hypothetical protein